MKNYHNTWLEIKVLGENCKKLGSGFPCRDEFYFQMKNFV